MPQDLSSKHHLIGRLFTWPQTETEWEAFKLSADQVAFYRENGYLAGIKLLNDEQVAALCTEVDELTNQGHPRHQLFYEYNSNEATEPNTVLFHALGAWRVTPGLHDILWNPAFLMAAAQLLGTPVRFWPDQIFYTPAPNGGGFARDPEA